MSLSLMSLTEKDILGFLSPESRISGDRLRCFHIAQEVAIQAVQILDEDFSPHIDQLLWDSWMLDRLVNGVDSLPADEVSPMVVLYGGPKNPILINPAYIKASGLNRSVITTHARSGTLNEAIYEWEDLRRSNTATLKLAKWEAYEDLVLTMKRTDIAGIWGSSGNENGGSIRFGAGSKHGFHSFSDNNSQGDLLNAEINAQEVTQALLGTECPPAVQIKLQTLSKLLSILDCGWNKSPFLMNVWDNKDRHNGRYVDVSWWPLEALHSPTSINVRYNGQEIERIWKKLEELTSVGHYRDVFTMQRPDGSIIPITWDRYWISVDEWLSLNEHFPHLEKYWERLSDASFGIGSPGKSATTAEM